MAKIKKPKVEIPEPEETPPPLPDEDKPVLSEDGVDLSQPNPKTDLKIGTGVRKVPVKE